MRANSHRFARGLIIAFALVATAFVSPTRVSAQPDVIVAELPSTVHYGPVGSVHSYAVGTTSCNLGSSILQWVSSNNQHPVITQNVFRLANDRFEMIGQGWLKHGFCALSGTVCGPCASTPCDTLGVGCSDPYSASLNGSQSGLGPKSEINASTGVFPYPFTAQGTTGNDIYKRIQVAESDLTTPSARYFVTSHYITPDEPPHGTDLNNESYREVTVSGSFALNVSGPTEREKYAVEAWRDIDASVTLSNVDVAGDGRFVVGAKAVPDGSLWRYEYAIENYNSDRGADGLSIPIPAGATVTAIGFKDIDYHSGEIYSNTDWSAADNGTSVDWASPETYGANPNTNALRWDTLYNFWFTCDLAPTSGTATLDLFKPGSPGTTTFVTVVPGTTGSPPFNDDCGNAVVVTDGSTAFSTANATTDGPSESCGSVSNDVWYRYLAPCDGDATFSLCGSSFDTQLALYTGCPGGSSAIACNDDACAAQSELTVTLTDGTEYWIRVGGTSTGSGALVVTDPVCGGGGDNDLCQDAIAIAEGVPTDGSTIGADSDGTATCASSASSPDVWYTYTPATSATVTLSTCNDANYDTALAIFDACGGNQLACLDDTSGCSGFTQTLSYAMTGGVTYYVRVSGYNGASGDFTLTVTGGGGTAGPTNDNCQDREGVGLGTPIPFDTTGATTDGPAHPECLGSGDDQVGSDIWYNYPSTFNGTITVSTCGSSYDTKLAIYDDAGCDNLLTRFMACDDDACAQQSELTIPVVIGRNYTIRVGGFGGATGSGNLVITGTPDDDCALVTTGLALRLESDSGVATSGSNVTGWSDQSGQGNDLTAIGAPTVITGATNGLDAIRFDGVDDRLQRTSGVTGLATGSDDRSVFVVASYTAGDVHAFSYGSAACGDVFALGVASDGDLAIDDGCSTFDTIAAGDGAGWLVQSAIVSTASVRHFSNGAQIGAPAAALTTTATGIALGSDLSGVLYCDMDVAAILVYDRALTEAERSQVEGYLELKYLGVTCDGNLPPYAADDANSVDQGDSVIVDVVANDSDDSAVDASTVTIVTSPASGTVSVNGTTGAVTYTHDDSATTSDTFVYTVMDDQGRVSNGAIVALTIAPCVPPAFTLQPTGGTWCDGASITLSVAAAGDARLTYQWRKNGSNIGGANNTSLSLDPATGADGGSYDCVVTNECGTATSTAATVTVNAPPSITQQPMSQSACEGGSITLNVVSGGTAPLGYQWRKNGASVTGATSSALTLAAITPSDAGSYDCVITNSCGTVTSNNAAVMVDLAPQIVTQPTNQSGCAGSSVTFAVTASGATPLTYQWRKNGSDVAGATNASLTIATVSASDTGSYDCSISGPCGNVISDSASLTVWVAPTILGHPSSVTDCEGESLTLVVTATGDLTLDYQWRKGGVAIGGATSNSYSINPLTASDTGSYDCLVSNSCGATASNPALVTVDSAPSMGEQPSGQIACAGDDVTFSATATGAAPLSYQWRMNGSAIGGATGSSLTVFSVESSDAGDYEVVVSNGCGTSTSSAATLTIEIGPAIAVHPTAQTGCLGSGVTLNVIATGSGPLGYQWRRNGTSVAGATSSILTIGTLTLGDAGNYDCVVSNGCGATTSSAAAVAVLDAPTITTGPSSVAQCEGTSVTLSVDASSSIALAYQWRKDGLPIAGAASDTLTLGSVTGADAGNYDVTVSNSCGSITSPTAAVTVLTAATITGQPSDAVVCLGQDATLTVAASGADGYQWRKDGAPIVGATATSLTVVSATAGDAGSYDVVVTNGCGSVTSSSALVTPTDVPTVTVSPISQTSCEGFDITLFAAASSDTALSYQWLQDGSNIPGATTSALTLIDVTIADAGLYEVQFFNECGFVLSAGATLTITAGSECDCNDNGILDGDEITAGTALDCNSNGIPDECDIASGSSPDLDGNGIPDECDPVVFVRGDSNADSIVNLADAVFDLSFFFGGGAAPSCMDALDANDDTLTNLADAVYILEWQFGGGSQPPAPYPLCGTDPTDTDPLGCDSYPICP